MFITIKNNRRTAKKELFTSSISFKTEVPVKKLLKLEKIYKWIDLKLMFKYLLLYFAL